MLSGFFRQSVETKSDSFHSEINSFLYVNIVWLFKIYLVLFQFRTDKKYLFNIYEQTFCDFMTSVSPARLVKVFPE